MARSKSFDEMSLEELSGVQRRLAQDIEDMGNQIARSLRNKKVMERELSTVEDLIAVKSKVKGWK